MPSSRYRFVMFFCRFHCCFIHERGSGPPISAPYSFCLGIVCRHHNEKKTTTKVGGKSGEDWGRKRERERQGERTTRVKSMMNQEKGVVPTALPLQPISRIRGRAGVDRVVTGLGNIEPILDPVYIEAMVERLLRVQCALYTVCFTHPRDQVRSAGPLNQFLIVLSSSPNFSKTLYLHQPKHDGGVSSNGDGGGGEGLGVNGVVFVGMVWIFYVRACVRRKGWKGEYIY